jgi:hypothetical protein
MEHEQQQRVHTGSTNSCKPKPCVWLEESWGVIKIEGFTCRRGTANPHTRVWPKREWGTNKFDKYVPERQQELELVYGQIRVEEHKH